MASCTPAYPEHFGWQPLVSVVMPLYNSAPFVATSISSVLSQTLRSWELIIVDDASEDDSANIASTFLEDARIELLRHKSNRGPGRARADAVLRAQGRYIAFLDADDVWMPDKLATQLAFMTESDAALCCTSYETVEEDGTPRNRVHVPAATSYREFLRNTLTCSHTVIADTEKIERGLLTHCRSGVSYDYPEDMDLWLRLLEAGYTMRGLDVVLAQYRRHPRSRSARPTVAIARTWRQYRLHEGLSAPKAAYCLLGQLAHAAAKRL